MTATPTTFRPNALRSLGERLQKTPRLSIAVAMALSTLIAWADYATGDEFPLLMCYLPPVMLVGWVSHLGVGAALATMCCTGWLADDLLGLGEEKLTGAEVYTAISHVMCFAIVIGTLHRLKQAFETERRMARTDGLTGLLNAKAFRDRAEEEVSRSDRTGRAVSVAFIDCDNFKTVNDTLGHLEGDRLLKAIAQQISKCVRDIDTPARMGGDEFAILLPETSEAEASVVVERLRQALSERMQQDDWPVTFSIGVAVYASTPDSVDELLRAADTLMYEVKRSQKDAVLLRLVA
ncbi:Response regulator PleD [Botrimarina colliarenosi]|uniref:diguanylate cyclase n=1 Tax=Botrimarina colliarenosi TaxID=2528001 RepID=A0A5C6AEB8_9BACT|nr:GGDEF domain-containing protein [Botrimarina colliarenosi]TWT97766.1 Response regulator PleD [Botrimarina colliarenosi]